MAAGYRALWQRCYGLPDPAAVPDWRALLAEAAARRPPPPSRRRVWLKRSALLGALVGAGAGVAVVMRRSRRRRKRLG